MIDARPIVADTRRFTIGRRLGEGGMGVVYEAYDRLRDELVALKTLSHTDSQSVARLKREFRALANVAHPNLVSLYELFAEGDEWFFTMELVEGSFFTEYIHPVAGRSGREGAPPGRDGSLDIARLTSALRQLATGVAALHAAGKVHRDLKPTNVLVTPAGRTVILDLGIARDLAPEAATTTTGTRLAGTVHYMSPEQAAGDPCTSASDWYSVGVMLYEALTGRMPFQGSALQVLVQKQIQDAPRISGITHSVPAELIDVCHDLLARTPEARPRDEDILRRLGVSETFPVIAHGSLDRGDLVGRDVHLRALEEALAASRDGAPVTVYVHGLSGMGKTTIVDAFRRRLVTERRAVVLSGKCFDRESLPYKAFDGVMDTLVRHLRSLPSAALTRVLPNDLHMAARLFPVLRGIDSIAVDPPGPFESPEPIELRRRAITALATLFARLAAETPLVVHVDDMQWSDTDSIALGRAIFAHRPPIPLLLVLSFRTEEVAGNPVLQSFLAHAGSHTKRELAVGPLPAGDAARLAASSLGTSSSTDRLVDIIVREAAGNPFFIERLARHVSESEPAAAVAPSLGDMIDASIARLPVEARPFLEALAVAGRPMDFAVAHRAAGLSGSAAEARALVAALRVSQLIRQSGKANVVEIYHDRIREAIMDRLAQADVAGLHRRLAWALAESSSDNPEALYEHYLAAGEIARAGEHAAKAAERAAEALAFDRAVTLYRKAIEIGSTKSSEVAAWYAGLGDALANGGRPGDAAHAFLAAAEHDGSPTQALRYRRSAAEWLLIGGYNDHGLEVTRSLLGEVGMRFPTSRRWMLVALLARRIQIRLRGSNYELHESSSVPEIDLLRMDICWTCAIGLTMTDYIVAAYFQARYLLLALGAGEAHRVTRALAFEVGFVSARGGRASRRTERLASDARALAERLDSARELGMVAVTTGSAWCLLGDFERAATLCREAETILRERCTGVQWELTTCQIFLLTSLTYLGETAEVVRRVPTLIDSARERGNLFEGIELRTRQNLYWLLRDEPETALAELSSAMAQWSRKGFYRQDYNSLAAQTNIDLYLGRSAVAWARLEQAWPALRSSQLLRVQLFRVEALFLRARTAIAAAERGHDRRKFLREAARDARRISREKMSWCVPFEPLLLASVAHLRGDKEESAALLAKAVAGFETAKMRLLASAARRRLAEVLGGDEGAQLKAEADSFMRRQAVAMPARFTSMLVPGFGNRSAESSGE